MASNNQGNGDDEFEEGFDSEEFAESDFDTEFDESEFSDDLPADDADFADEDFENEEWQETSPGAKQKKEPNLYRTREKQGLSFNTIVIIGAVILGGGVMAMTVMNKSAEMASGSNIFQSMLSISGVMDGTLFGDKPAEPTAEEVAANEQNQEQGFLNNPDVLNGNPPQPVPLAPQENEDPLVPLPDDMYAEMPRGPEDGAPETKVAIAETPIVPVSPAADPVFTDTPVAEELPSDKPAPSAEDILKQAMANREKKKEQETAKPAPQPVEEKPEASEPVVAKTPVIPAPVPQPSGPTPEELAANTKAVEALDSRIEAMMDRMEKIEGEIGTVREAKSTDYQELEKTLSDMKQEITSLKNKPAAPAVTTTPKKEVASAVETAPKKAVEPIKEEPVPAKTVKKKVDPTPVVKKATPAPSATATASAGLWELRAAQPGRAWVSKPGARDMQGVEVGQNLTGIGRVTAITYQNGRWAVIGTQGQIKQ